MALQEHVIYCFFLLTKTKPGAWYILHVKQILFSWQSIYIYIYTTHISVDLAYHEIVRAKIGIGGIKSFILV